MKWSRKNRVVLNPDKCKELRISFSRNPEAFDSVSIDDKEIEVVNSAKLLGITISDNLTWNAHINELVKKTNKKTILSCTAETGPTTSIRPTSFLSFMCLIYDRLQSSSFSQRASAVPWEWAHTYQEKGTIDNFAQHELQQSLQSFGNNTNNRTP